MLTSGVVIAFLGISRCTADSAGLVGTGVEGSSGAS